MSSQAKEIELTRARLSKVRETLAAYRSHHTKLNAIRVAKGAGQNTFSLERALADEAYLLEAQLRQCLAWAVELAETRRADDAFETLTAALGSPQRTITVNDLIARIQDDASLYDLLDAGVAGDLEQLAEHVVAVQFTADEGVVRMDIHRSDGEKQPVVARLVSRPGDAGPATVGWLLAPTQTEILMMQRTEQEPTHLYDQIVNALVQTRESAYAHAREVDQLGVVVYQGGDAAALAAFILIIIGLALGLGAGISAAVCEARTHGAPSTSSAWRSDPACVVAAILGALASVTLIFAGVSAGSSADRRPFGPSIDISVQPVGGPSR